MKVLEESPETPLDKILVQQVKLQRLTDEIPKQCINLESTEHTRLLRDFQTKALLSRLEEIRQNMPKNLPNDGKCEHLR